MVRRPLTFIVGLILSLGAACIGLSLVPLGASLSMLDSFAQSSPYQPNPGCSPNVVPVGQADPSSEPEPMDPIWCFTLTQEPSTFVSGANDWVDNFNTNVQMGHLNDGDMGYRVFDDVNTGKNKTQHFVNNNHWMDDNAGGSQGGAMLRPNRSFTFENGKLVVEGDVAAGITDYGNGVIWPEIDVSMAPAPTSEIVDSLYAYGHFGGSWTVGCRLHPAGNPICSVESSQTNVAGSGNNSNCNLAPPSRIMEISDFEICGSSHYGGNRATGNNAQFWRQCQHNQMDMFCRDRFRLELTKSSLTLYVNGELYFQDANWPAAKQLPDSMVNGGKVYVYFNDWEDSPTAPAYRIHWGRLAVNPHNPDGSLAAPSAAPSFCLGMPQNTCDDMNGGDGTGGSPNPPPMSTPAITPLTTQSRVLDTRTSGGPLQTNATRCVVIAGAHGVPADATAALLNVTAVRPTVDGWLSLYPNGQAVPPTSSLNFTAGQFAVANNTVARIGSGGQVCVDLGAENSAAGSSQVVVDLTGFVPKGSPVALLSSPARLVDTSRSGGPITSGTSRCFSVAGVASIPAHAAAVLLNVTATEIQGTGALTVYPDGQTAPNASTLTFDPSEYAISNGTVTRVGTNDKVCVRVSAQQPSAVRAQVLIDVVGSVPSSGSAQLPMLAAPQQVLNRQISSGSASTRCFTVAGVAGVPADAAGVVVTITASGYTTRGWLSAYPAGQQAPTTSILDFDPAAHAVTNTAILATGSGGQICIDLAALNGAPSNATVTVDTLGYLPAQ